MATSSTPSTSVVAIKIDDRDILDIGGTNGNIVDPLDIDGTGDSNIDHHDILNIGSTNSNIIAPPRHR